MLSISILSLSLSTVFWTQSVPASAAKTSTTFKASSSAAEAFSAVFPPPKATNTGPAVDALFPSSIGFLGTIQTGDEALQLAKATQIPLLQGMYPLASPPPPKGGPKSFNIMKHWSNLSPWFSVPTFGLPDANQLIPDGCEVVQVHILHRHGARYPSGGGDSSPASFAERLRSAVTSGTGFTATGDLKFLDTWTLQLGAEILTPFGRQQMYELGVAARMKYGQLLKNFSQLPVFRTTSEDRMLHSALNFAAGFFGVPDYTTSYHQLIMIEAQGFNNTLQPALVCPNAQNQILQFGAQQANVWGAIYTAPTVKRLQNMLTGFTLTMNDVLAMQNLCAYETNALGFSPFCGIFTKKEWNGFEYFIDLGFWYAQGPGNPATAAQGIGYVQELIARLTQTPIATHNSTTNSTLSNNPTTSPLNQPIYVDATHDTVVTAITVALNFTSFAAGGPLPTDDIPQNRTYRVRRIAPFGTNLVAQVLSCPSLATNNAAKFPNDATHIRFLLNDAAVPLTGIQGCTPDPNGLCVMETFIDAMRKQIRDIDFAFDCFANFSVPIPDNIIDGRPPASIRPPVESS